MSGPFPSADHVAWAIVAAAREAGEDPLAVAEGAIPSRARHYAFNAIRTVFPEVLTPRIAAMVGAVNLGSAASNAATAQRAKWWSDKTLLLVVDAVRAVHGGSPQIAIAAETPAPKPAVEAPRASVTPKVARPAVNIWDAPPVSRRGPGVALTADICGDPAPGRSALDQRRGSRL